MQNLRRSGTLSLHLTMARNTQQSETPIKVCPNELLEFGNVGF